MELRHLKYFVGVAEELHFRRAATKMHVAQPALSEQVRKLEAELGVQLLIRSSRSVQLTPAGASFLRDARRILHHADVAVDAARTAAIAGDRRVRLGVTPLGPPAALRASFGALCAAPPRARVRVDIETGDARGLLFDLRSGHIDAAAVHLPAPTAGLRIVELGRDVATAVMVRRPGRSSGPVVLAALTDEPLLILRRRLDPAFHDAVVSAFVEHELLPQLVDSRAATVEQLLLEVATGAGACLVPRGAAESMGAAGLDLRPIADARPNPPTGLVVRDEAPSRALAALLHEVTRAVEVARRPALALVGDDLPTA